MRTQHARLVDTVLPVPQHTRVQVSVWKKVPDGYERVGNWSIPQRVRDDAAALATAASFHNLNAYQWNSGSNRDAFITHIIRVDSPRVRRVRH